VRSRWDILLKLWRGVGAVAKVLVLAPFPPPIHGFSFMMLRLTQTLEKEHEVSRKNIGTSVENPVLRYLLLTFHALAAIPIVCLFRATGGQFVCIGVNGGRGLLFTLMLAIACRVLGLGVRLHHHSYAYIHKCSNLMHILVQSSDGEHVFLSKQMQRQFSALYPLARPFHVVPNATFVSPRHSSQPLKRPLRIGFLSNLSREKGLFQFLELAEKLQLSGADCEVILAGGTSDLADAKAIQESAVTKYLGPVYGAEKDAFFDEIDVFVFPTDYANEAQPTVIYEALASGIPVIARGLGAIEQQVGKAGLTVPPSDDFVDVAFNFVEALSAERLEILSARAKIKFYADREEGLQNLNRLIPND